jgi:hypothetical protein
VMRSGRPLPPLPGQRPGPTVRLARNSSMNDVNLYQNQ